MLGRNLVQDCFRDFLALVPFDPVQQGSCGWALRHKVVADLVLPGCTALLAVEIVQLVGQLIDEERRVRHRQLPQEAFEQKRFLDFRATHAAPRVGAEVRADRRVVPRLTLFHALAHVPGPGREGVADGQPEDHGEGHHAFE